MDNFLKQLGDGFAYMENEYKIMIGNKTNYIDLLLFNVIYNCYVRRVKMDENIGIS